MASYCGTTDCRLICNEWTNMAGTDAAAIIAEASAMTDACLGDFDISPPQPLSFGGTVYDYYIRNATSKLSCWLAAESLYRGQLEVGAEAWWDRYRTEALETFEGLRTGRHTLGSRPNVYERGIGPAIPALNGTITAPYNGCLSNSHVTGDYYQSDSVARTFVVQLDGEGSTAFQQTFRWQYRNGTAWENEALPLQPLQWTALAWGVSVTFDPAVCGTELAVGQRWEIACTPSRGRNYPGPGLRGWSRVRG
jgi:hypothetical protein